MVTLNETQREETLKQIKEEGNITEDRSKELRQKIDNKQFNNPEKTAENILEEALELEELAETLYTLSYAKKVAKQQTEQEHLIKDVLSRSKEFTELVANAPSGEVKRLLPRLQ